MRYKQYEKERNDQGRIPFSADRREDQGTGRNDRSGLINSSLEGNARRAIDFHEGDEMNEDAFKTLIRAAAALNRSSAR